MESALPHGIPFSHGEKGQTARSTWNRLIWEVGRYVGQTRMIDPDVTGYVMYDDASMVQPWLPSFFDILGT